jgi:hypothetical protein
MPTCLSRHAPASRWGAGRAAPQGGRVTDDGSLLLIHSARERLPATRSIGLLRRTVVDFADTCGACAPTPGHRGRGLRGALTNVVKHAYVDRDTPPRDHRAGAGARPRAGHRGAHPDAFVADPRQPWRRQRKCCWSCGQHRSPIAMTCSSAGISVSSCSRNAMKSHWLRVGAVMPATVPECTCNAAKRFVVALRAYSLSRRAGRPRCVSRSGRAG